MSKIDLFDEVVEKRNELAATIAANLSPELNTVVPVSAGIWQVVCRLKGEPSRMQWIKDALANIPEERLWRMLLNDRAFLREYPDCPVPVDVRQGMLDGIPWRVFVLVAREVRAKTVEDAVKALEELSDFVELRRLLQSHFFRRGQLLRCFRIVSDLYAMLGEIRRSTLHEHRQTIKRTQKDLIEFTDFIIEHPRGKSDTANKLRRFLSDHVSKDNADELEKAVEGVIAKVEDIRGELENVNREFQGLKLLEDAPVDAFTQEELLELRELFGLYARTRQMQPDEAR